MERLVFDPGKAAGHSRPVGDGPLATALQIDQGARGVRIDGPLNHVRNTNGRRAIRQAQQRGLIKVLLGLELLVLNGPVQALLVSHGRVALRSLSLVHSQRRHLGRGRGRVLTRRSKGHKGHKLLVSTNLRGGKRRRRREQRHT